MKISEHMTELNEAILSLIPRNINRHGLEALIHALCNDKKRTGVAPSAEHGGTQ